MPLTDDEDKPPRADIRLLLVELGGGTAEAAASTASMFRLAGFDSRIATTFDTGMAESIAWQPHMVVVSPIESPDCPAIQLLRRLSSGRGQIPMLFGVITTYCLEPWPSDLEVRGVMLRTAPFWIDGTPGGDDPFAPVRTGPRR